MTEFLIKMKYPDLNYDTNYGVWGEKENYNCDEHGVQECNVDTAMVIDGDVCTQKQLEEAYCSVCKKNEQDRIELEQRKIDAEKFKRELLESQRERRCQKMSIPYRFQDASFKNFTAKTQKQKAALNACQAFAENFETLKEDKGGLILMGTVGTGKTHLSIAIGRELLRQDLSVKYTTIGRLIRAVRSTWSDKETTEQDVYNSLSRNELLIIDEIGVQNCTENEKNILFEVINARYEAQRPTILVSNLNLGDLTEIVGQRIVDRISESGGNRIVFDWESYRQRVA